MGLDAAASRLRVWGSQVLAFGTRLAAASAVINAPFALGVARFVEMGSAMQDMSDRTGLTVEVLAELNYAAELSAATTEDLERSMRHLAQSIVAANNGAQASVEAFDDIGISAATLMGMPLDRALQAVAQAISEIDDPARRTAAALEIFGRNGAALLPMLRAGRDGIIAMRQEAQRLGIVMSAADAAAAESLGDRLGDLVRIARSVMFQFGAAIAPAVSLFVNVIREGAIWLNNFIARNRDLIRTLALIAGSLALAAASVLTMGATIWALGGSISVVTHAFSGLFKFLTSVGVALFIIRISALLMGFMGIANVALGARIAIFLLFRTIAITTLAMQAMTIAAIAWSYVVAAAELVFGAFVVVLKLVTGLLFPLVGLFYLSSAAVAAWGVICSVAGYLAAQAMFVASIGAKVLAAAEFLLSAASTTTGTSFGFATIMAYALDVATTVLTFGINLLIGSLILLIAALATVGTAIPVVALAYIVFLMGELAVHTINTTGTITRGFEAAGNAITDSFRRSLEQARFTFSAIASLALTTWQGIRLAIARGDWDQVWAILRLSAQLAWVHIRAFGIHTWNEWKATAIIAFHEIADELSDTFSRVAQDMITTFRVAWGEITRAFFLEAAHILGHPVLGVVMSAIPGAPSLAGLTAESMRQRAEQARADALREAFAGNATLDSASISAWFDRAVNEVNIDMLRQQANEALLAGRDDEAAALNSQLSNLLAGGPAGIAGGFAASLGNISGRVNIPRAEDLLDQLGGGRRGALGGSFSASELFGAFGASAESPLQRLLRVERDALDLHRVAAGLLGQVLGVAQALERNIDGIVRVQ